MIRPAAVGGAVIFVLLSISAGLFGDDHGVAGAVFLLLVVVGVYLLLRWLAYLNRAGMTVSDWGVWAMSTRRPHYGSGIRWEDLGSAHCHVNWLGHGEVVLRHRFRSDMDVSISKLRQTVRAAQAVEGELYRRRHLQQGHWDELR